MINLFKPNVDIDDALIHYKETLESGWFGRGNMNNKFEELLSNFLGVKKDQVHTVSSCTDAIFAICDSLSLMESDIVIVPTNSFPSVPTAVLASGAKLEILDIDISTGNICINELEKFCKNQTPSAIFVTDYGGIPVDVKKLKKVVGKNCLILVDAAASLGTSLVNNTSYIHKSADFVCYSFDAMKLITTGEGGAAVIKNKKLMQKFKEFTYLGLPARSKSGLDVAKSKGLAGWWEYDITCLGRRAVMSNLAASLGVSQMKGINKKLKIRSKNRKLYESSLASLEDIKFISQSVKKYNYSNYFCTIYSSRRDDLALYLLENGVYSSFRYWPINKISFFKDFCKDNDYPNSNFMAYNALNLPIHDSLNGKDIKKITSLIIEFYKTNEKNQTIRE